MHGNVWEWCKDHCHDNYDGAPDDGRAWVDRDKGADRVIRGGSWDYIAVDCRSAGRDGHRPTAQSDCGFRLVRLLSSPKIPENRSFRS